MFLLPDEAQSWFTTCLRSKSRSRHQRSSMASATKARFVRAVLLASTTSIMVSSASNSMPYPPLSLVESALLTTAKEDFNGHTAAFHAATKWTSEQSPRVSRGSAVGSPHLACAEYGEGRKVLSILQGFLSVRMVVNNADHGACFLATAKPLEASRMLADPSQFGLHSVAPYPSALKISPGLLDHGSSSSVDGHGEGKVGGSGRLSTMFGRAMREGTVHGLSVELSPGTLHADDADSEIFMDELMEDLMSESIDLHGINFWSDPAMSEGEHLSIPEGALRAREWSRAAKVVHELGERGGPSPGDVCSWDSVSALQPADDVLILSGERRGVVRKR